MGPKPRRKGVGRTYRPRMTDRIAHGLKGVLVRDALAWSENALLQCERDAARKWINEQIRWWERKKGGSGE